MAVILTAVWLQIKLYETEYTSYLFPTTVVFDKAPRQWAKSNLCRISCSSEVEMERWGEEVTDPASSISKDALESFRLQRRHRARLSSVHETIMNDPPPPTYWC